MRRATRREFIQAAALAALALQAGADEATASDVVAVRVPMTENNGVYYVQAKINGATATLLVDTGSNMTFVNAKSGVMPTFVASDDNPGSVRVSGGSLKARRARIRLQIGTRIFGVDAMIGDFKIPDADGSVGSDVLTACGAVTFDYVAKSLVLAGGER